MQLENWAATISSRKGTEYFNGVDEQPLQRARVATPKERSEDIAISNARSMWSCVEDHLKISIPSI